MGLDRKLKLLGPELPIAEPQCWLESAVPARERKQSFQVTPWVRGLPERPLSSGRGRGSATIAHSFLSREEEN
jgi:hypothetical protein